MKPRNKLVLLGASIVLITVFASGAWFWGADHLRSLLLGKIEEASKRGHTVTCNDLDVRGFPFRIGVHCARTAFDNDKNRLGLAAGELRTTAQIYDPGHIVSELDGPLTLTTKNSSVKAKWDNLRASAVLDLSTLDRASIIANKPQITVQIPLLKRLGNIEASDVKFHLRQNGQDLDLALSGSDMEFTRRNGKELIPSSQLDVISTISGKAHWLNHSELQNPISLRNSDINLHGASIVVDNKTAIIAKGPLQINRRGLLNGELTITIEDLPNLMPLLQNIRPDLAKEFSNVLNVISALNQSGEKNEIKLTVNFENGAARAGFIPLGFVPAIR